MDTNLLTEREYEIACMAASGMKRTEIADKLYLNWRTVDSHLRTIYRKFGIKGKHELPDTLTQLSAHRTKNKNLDTYLDIICNGEKMTVSHLAEISGYSKTTTCAYLKKKGLMIRVQDRSLVQLAKIHGQPYSRVYERIKLLGWSVEDALNIPRFGRTKWYEK